MELRLSKQNVMPTVKKVLKLDLLSWKFKDVSFLCDQDIKKKSVTYIITEK